MFDPGTIGMTQSDDVVYSRRHVLAEGAGVIDSNTIYIVISQKEGDCYLMSSHVMGWQNFPRYDHVDLTKMCKYTWVGNSIKSIPIP